MATDISGWVEVTKFERWWGVVKVNGILYRNYPMFEFLFGVRNRSFENPIAENRGIPFNASWEVKRDTLFQDVCHSYTWIAWREIEAIDWQLHPDLLSNDWKLLLEIMRLFATTSWIGSEGVRLVVGFD